ncbi:MAG TPA: hypothetical protein HA226_04150 [Nanoarchaeota archaeon]|nr:MAG: hypothetical protein QT09_C0004G0073 [archaeon GW2011_AR18]HIH25932.1 hypothetical protein [Nanoarchaeota archaeon]
MRDEIRKVMNFLRKENTERYHNTYSDNYAMKVSIENGCRIIRVEKFN